MNKQRANKKSTRRGAVAVEFAFVAPIFVIILVGMVQVGGLLETQSNLSKATSEGGRIGAMDREALGVGDASTNDLVRDEVRNFLNSKGLPGDDIEVKITQVGNHGQPFNLDDPANSGELFEVYIEYPYDDACCLQLPGSSKWNLKGQAIFRNATVTVNN
jgi:hypothetical protein